ncbi:MAG: FecR domain-containing protein, partial [Cyanobacteria bacterium P01_A01_bin.84]
MFRKIFPVVVVSLWGTVFLPIPQAIARVPLTRAEIQYLRNSVRLIPRNKPRRWARLRDRMIPGDGLSTGKASLAELRFNDGSRARVGQRAMFRFLPRTRNFRLNNGTVLLLIPPGKGKTGITTPNAAAAIRGSALFVRYDKQTDTTIVGALTDSGIEVSNKNKSQTQELKAGQLIIIVKDRIKSLYDFDLRTFYETSELVNDLNLDKQGIAVKDSAIASVKAETTEALKEQTPVIGKGVVENPSFIQLTPDPPQISNENPTPSIPYLEGTGEIIRPPQKVPENTDPTVVEPIVPANPEPPPVQPPTTGGGETEEPPIVNPPTVPANPEPPPVQPPTTGGGETEPPIVNPPTVPANPESPPVQPPTTGGGETEPPIVNPPTVPTKPESPPVQPPTTDGGGETEPPIVNPPTVPTKPESPPVQPPTTDGGGETEPP